MIPHPTLSPEELQTYQADVLAWQQDKEDKLRADDGWLTLTGLYWLHEGVNTVGSDPAADVVLPASAPHQLGTITLNLKNPSAVLDVISDSEVTADQFSIKTVALRSDTDVEGKTRVAVGSVRFHLIKRGDRYGVRVSDQQNPARQEFTGRRWFEIQPDYRITGVYTPYPETRELGVESVAGIDLALENPGYVDFALGEHAIRLEAFSGEDGQVWFVFRDTSERTYRPGRFLYATPAADNTVILDFNKAYNPPCAFTPYATCPLPPKQNVLAFAVEVGEIAPQE